jgi:hypothetical protein
VRKIICARSALHHQAREPEAIVFITIILFIPSPHLPFILPGVVSEVSWG